MWVKALILFNIFFIALWQTSELQKSISRGASVYEEFCVQCHKADGKGMKGNYPPLAGSDYLRDKRVESIKGVKYGQKGEIIVNGVKYNSIMAPMGLSNQEVADVMNYIMNSWGNKSDKIVTPEEVSKIEK